MNGDAPKRSDWFTPQTILPVLGMLGMGYASYTTFQRDTSDKVAALEYRVTASEKVIAAHDLLLTSHGNFNAEANLRLDRLERRK